MNPIFRILYKLHRAASWGSYKAARRLTRPGLMVLAVMIVAVMMAPDTDNNFAYQAFTLALFTIVISSFFTFRLGGKFSVERSLPRFGTVGKSIYYSVRVRNLTRKAQQGLSVFETLADPRPSFPDWLQVQLADERQLRSFRRGTRKNGVNPYKLADVKEAFLPTIPPGQEAETKVELIPLRRGILRFSAVTLARTDPLGLARALRKIRLPQTVIVLPKRYLVPPIALPGTTKYQEGGVAMASRIGVSDEFVSLRDYRYGDPPRHIHWRSWAKSGKPVVKEYEDEFFVRHALVLDTFTEEPYGQIFEEAVSVASSFACTIDTQESLLDLLFVGPETFYFTAGRGLAHTDQMLEILASVRPCRTHEFSRLENLVLDRAASVSGCVCVFIAWDDARRRFVGKLEALGLPVMVLVVTGAKDPDPQPGPLQHAENFYVLKAGAIEAGLSKLR